MQPSLGIDRSSGGKMWGKQAMMKMSASKFDSPLSAAGLLRSPTLKMGMPKRLASTCRLSVTGMVTRGSSILGTSKVGRRKRPRWSLPGRGKTTASMFAWASMRARKGMVEKTPGRPK